MTDTPRPRTRTRDDKHHQTSLRVERSAVSLVLEHGFDNVTVDMICSQSGISQRTFFNYFKTKKAAIIGAEPPSIDESRAREFIAAPGDDLLPDVLTLMSAIGPRDGIEEELFTDRLRVFGLHPQLMQEQMDRMTRVTSEVTELVYLRLGRAAIPQSESDADRVFRRGQAGLLTHAMLGVVRFMALQWIPDFDRLSPTDNGSIAAERVLPPSLAESLERTIILLRRTLGSPGLGE
ncbi:transcriptional regulator, TetR family [Cryobacterium flavum]|uniref:TetR family transcriptional regulator n=1 Tax=Cryobacterium flavum TaxID=1424659 RepID=A0A4R8VG94_9MICO|nr:MULTISPECIES: TetR family transcriptional regulator [Cryobacterium]TFB82261.1 TetR family transcriptional regulator [Cryobacterium flavum]SDN94419.1 transcriptional regulator, TetR family [Cryobacterium flavum]